MPRRWVVHEHGRGIAPCEPLIAPRRGVTGEWPVRGITPARACGEGPALPLALAHASLSGLWASVAASASLRGPQGVIVMSRAASSSPGRETHGPA